MDMNYYVSDNYCTFRPRTEMHMTINPTSRVAILGSKAPIWLILTAVGTIKVGFGDLLATFGATFRITR